MVIPFVPGGPADLMGRAIGAKLRDSMGQPVVIDNRPGAAGVVASELVVRSAPDGYTVLYAVSTITVSPWVQKLSFDTEKDLTPVTQTTATSYVLVTTPKFPANSFEEFLAYVKAQPGRLTYGSYGPGSGPHITTEILMKLAGLNITHVPYKGSAPMLTDLIGGQINLAFDTTSSIVPYTSSGRLKALAIAGPLPIDLLPGVPTIAQTYPGFDTDAWQGVFVPAGTPKDIVAKLHAEIVKAIHLPDVAKLISDRGFRLVGSSPAQFSAYVKAELWKYEKVIRENNIRAE